MGEGLGYLKLDVEVTIEEDCSVCLVVCEDLLDFGLAGEGVIALQAR
jgi:hypothetical protein